MLIDDPCDLSTQPDSLAAFHSGDPDTLSQVYHTHVAEIERMVRRGALLANSERLPGTPFAEDQRTLVTDIFTQAFAPTARRSYDGSHPYATFLRSVAASHLIQRQNAHDDAGNARGSSDANKLAIDDANLAPLPPEETVQQPSWDDVTGSAADDAQLALAEAKSDSNPHSDSAGPTDTSNTGSHATAPACPLKATTRAFVCGRDKRTQAFIRLRFFEGRSLGQVAKASRLARHQVRAFETTVLQQLKKFLHKRSK